MTMKSKQESEIYLNNNQKLKTLRQKDWNPATQFKTRDHDKVSNEVRFLFLRFTASLIISNIIKISYVLFS